MKIRLVKFGKILTSRPEGKEAFLAIQPILYQRKDNVEIDFSGVLSLSPGWADEFFRGLKEFYGDKKIIYLSSNNPSVKATLDILNS